MVGIVSYGAYVPRYRLNRKTLSAAMGWFSGTGVPGEKAVANYDEDSVTMAVAAGFDSLAGFNREALEALYLATTTAPYRRGRMLASWLPHWISMAISERPISRIRPRQAPLPSLQAAMRSRSISQERHGLRF